MLNPIEIDENTTIPTPSPSKVVQFDASDDVKLSPTPPTQAHPSPDLLDSAIDVAANHPPLLQDNSSPSRNRTASDHTNTPSSPPSLSSNIKKRERSIKLKVNTDSNPPTPSGNHFLSFGTSQIHPLSPSPIPDFSPHASSNKYMSPQGMMSPNGTSKGFQGPPESILPRLSQPNLSAKTPSRYELQKLGGTLTPFAKGISSSSFFAAKSTSKVQRPSSNNSVETDKAHDIHMATALRQYAITPGGRARSNFNPFEEIMVIDDDDSGDKINGGENGIERSGDERKSKHSTRGGLDTNSYQRIKNLKKLAKWRLPASQFRAFWETLNFVTTCINSFIIPVRLVFGLRKDFVEGWTIFNISVVCQCVFAADVYLRARKFYYEDGGGEYLFLRLI
jgi:hypothetical protein